MILRVGKSSLQQLIIMIVYLAIGLTDITNKISDAENAAISDPAVWTEAYKTSYIESILSNATDNMTFALRSVMAFLPIVFMGIGLLITMKKYKIDEKEYSRILSELEARKQK